MADIMADNQTEAVLSILDRGEADDRTRDKVSAALLRSQTKMSQQLDVIQRDLWTIEKLEKLVDDRHRSLCDRCELRSATAPRDKAAEKRPWFEAVLASESFRYFILVLLLVWAVIYMRTGMEGVEAVKSGVVHTVTGGTK